VFGKNIKILVCLFLCQKKFYEDYYFDLKQFIEATVEPNYESILESLYIKP